MVVISAMHLLVASIVLIFSQISGYISVFLVGLIAISYVYYYRLHVSKNLVKSVSELQLNSQGDWSLRSKKGLSAVNLEESSFSSRYGMILNFSSESEHYSVFITKNMLNHDDFRHIMVRLTTNKEAEKD